MTYQEMTGRTICAVRYAESGANTLVVLEFEDGSAVGFTSCTCCDGIALADQEDLSEWMADDGYEMERVVSDG